MFAKVDHGAMASHAAEGPPLQTFLFSTLGEDLSEDERVQMYADVTADKAIRTLVTKFPGLSWDNRLMVLPHDHNIRPLSTTTSLYHTMTSHDHTTPPDHHS